MDRFYDDGGSRRRYLIETSMVEEVVANGMTKVDRGAFIMNGKLRGCAPTASPRRLPPEFTNLRNQAKIAAHFAPLQSRKVLNLFAKHRYIKTFRVVEIRSATLLL
ncbi:hypothetical protein L2E82_50769 [Cichorium intybus]|nr:hypothetical protein L2E82_50769 [Cichorium intybus]